MIALREGIHLQLGQCLGDTPWISVGDAYAEKNVEGRRVTHRVASHVRRDGLPRAEHEILRGGLGIRKRALPRVIHSPLYAARRHL